MYLGPPRLINSRDMSFPTVLAESGSIGVVR
jgi:hypothetical protein